MYLYNTAKKRKDLMNVILLLNWFHCDTAAAPTPAAAATTTTSTMQHVVINIGLNFVRLG
jgi:hypothetical protein